MNDKLRTALHGGGRIIITIREDAKRDYHLQVMEDCGRLTGVKSASLCAEELDQAENPDGLFQETLERLVQECHINQAASMQHGKERRNE